MLTAIQQPFFVVVFILLGICMIVCLIAAIRGPELGDRIVAANMIGTLTIATICLLSYALQQSWLLDVALIYTMISFLGSRCIDTYFYTSLQKPCQRAGERIMRWNGFVLLPQRSVSAAVYL